MFEQVEKMLKPYKNGFMSFSTIPEAGVEREEIICEMERFKSIEEAMW